MSTTNTTSSLDSSTAMALAPATNGTDSALTTDCTAIIANIMATLRDRKTKAGKATAVLTQLEEMTYKDHPHHQYNCSVAAEHGGAVFTEVLQRHWLKLTPLFRSTAGEAFPTKGLRRHWGFDEKTRIVMLSLTALDRIAINAANGNNRIAFQDSIRTEKTIETILKVMDMYPFDKELQSGACRVLFSALGENTTNVDYFVAELSGHLTIFEAIKKDPRFDTVCTLFSLLQHGCHQTTVIIAEAGAIEILINAMDACPQDADAQHVGFCCLLHAADFSVVLKRRVLDADGLRVVHHASAVLQDDEGFGTLYHKYLPLFSDE